jgi:hypothetical protein
MVAGLHKRSLLLGVLVPLALLAGQASSIVHSMVVEHQRCREHGELIHRVLIPGASAAVAAQPSRDENRNPRLLAAGVAEGHGHDHCLSASDRRDGLRPPERPVASMVATPSGPLALAGVPAPLASGALILFAPKTSPPPIDG